MSLLVATGAMLQCSFGVAPSTLTAIPKGPPVLAGGPPAATIMDYLPIANIMSFGMCMAPTNPTVITATAAAAGVLTPMPCIPLTTAPWIVGSPTTLIGGIPALNNTSTCLCTWLGVITITSPGQVQTQIP